MTLAVSAAYAESLPANWPAGEPAPPPPMPVPSRAGRYWALQRLARLQLEIAFEFLVEDESPWKPAELDLLRTMRARGDSYSRCAAALPGRTRNACISKAWRLGLFAPPNGADDIAAMLARVPLTSKRLADWAGEGAGGDVIAIPSAGKTLLELGDHDCRWPFGEGRHMRFCGAGQHDEGPYCHEHATLAVEPRNSCCD